MGCQHAKAARVKDEDEVGDEDEGGVGNEVVLQLRGSRTRHEKLMIYICMSVCGVCVFVCVECETVKQP